MSRPCAQVACFYGSLISNGHAVGRSALGTPETVTGSIATGQLARHTTFRKDMARLYFQHRGCSIDTGDHVSLWALSLGAHMVYHAHGWMEGGLTSSYEKTIVDSEMISMMNALARPIDLADADEVMTAIAEVGPGVTFWNPDDEALRNRVLGADAGGLAGVRVLGSGRRGRYHPPGQQDVETALEAYEKPAFDAGRADELAEFVARRKEEIGTTEI